jgi:SPP1 gp7 family putative phage head morphogenesis protein
MRDRQQLISERFYLRSLLRLVRQIRMFVLEMPEVEQSEMLAETLRRYAELIFPWAITVATRSIRETTERERRITLKEAKEQKSSAYWLRLELDTTEKGTWFKAELDRQVHLIQDIPLDAARRIRKIVTEGAINGASSGFIRNKIMETAGVSESKAKLIARTETARTFSVLTEARARSVGSTHYVWRTIGDSDVRHSHQVLNKGVFAWDDPPIAELDGTRHHPGRFPNCRCFAQPIIPDD